MGAYKTDVYKNIFLWCGYKQEDIDNRIKDAFQTMFYGSIEERIYYPVGEDMGYMVDTGNIDVRTEGMSYGMMFCVQLNKKDEFDRLWKWARTYMYMTEGDNIGYFAWSCQLDGTKNSWGPAPDGEEFFAMALFFASHRWGDGNGIFNYSKEAKELLKTCVHKGEDGSKGEPMWDKNNLMIKFIPNCNWSDPSYHTPHFYELFALWSYEEDKEFWKEVAKVSRKYLKAACHPDTGMCAEYANYDGTPHILYNNDFGGRHDWFYSDSYRTIANIALDHEWFSPDEWSINICNSMQKFFSTKADIMDLRAYLIDGTPLEEKALHPVGLIATLAQASLCADGEYGKKWVDDFWNMPLRKGVRRYYDNCLYLFSLLALSGNYRIW